MNNRNLFLKYILLLDVYIVHDKIYQETNTNILSTLHI